MTRTEHLLVMLAEECTKVARMASKALRFGLGEAEPGQELTNAQRLIGEVNDFLAVYQMLAGPYPSTTAGLFQGKPEEWQAAVMAKQQKVEQFLQHSRQANTLSQGERAMETHADLLAACRLALRAIDGPTYDPASFDEAEHACRTAIAKATGE